MDAPASPVAIAATRRRSYSQYSSGRRPSIARIFARLQSTQRNSVRPASNSTVHPGGTPPSAHASVRPQREHIREAGGAGTRS